MLAATRCLVTRVRVNPTARVSVRVNPTARGCSTSSGSPLGRYEELLKRRPLATKVRQRLHVPKPAFHARSCPHNTRSEAAHSGLHSAFPAARAASVRCCTNRAHPVPGARSTSFDCCTLDGCAASLRRGSRRLSSRASETSPVRFATPLAARRSHAIICIFTIHKRANAPLSAAPSLAHPRLGVAQTRD